MLQQAGGLVAALGLLWLLASIRLWRTRRSRWLALQGLSELMLSLLFLTYRNPKRQPLVGDDLILAPADGRIRTIEPSRNPFLRGPGLCITIQIGLQHAHVVRVPISGVVSHRWYEPRRPGANTGESNALGIEGQESTRVLLRQVASRLWRPGKSASNLQSLERRARPYHQGTRKTGMSFLASVWPVLPVILCWPDLDDRVLAGDIAGHLLLGGLVELHVPESVHMVVRPGQQIKAGETIVAVLPPLEP